MKKVLIRAQFRVFAASVSGLFAVFAGDSSWSADFNSGQKASIVLGQANFRANDAPSPPNAGSLRGPNAVAVDPVSRKVFVCDTSNHRVLRYPANSLLNDGALAEAVIGQATLNSGSSNRGNTGPSAVTNDTLSSPQGLAFSDNGILYIADTGNNRILRVDNPSTGFSPVANGVLGQRSFSTFGAGTTASALRSPTGVAVGTGGTLWVADTLNNRVLRFDAAASAPNGASANAVLGQPDFVSGGFGRSRSVFDRPRAVAISPSGALWVADTGNDRVLRFDGAAALGNGAPADSVLGQRDFVTRETLAGRRGLRSPYGLAVDSTGRLWVASGGNNRVTWLNNAASAPDFARFHGVLGQPNFNEVAGATTRKGLYEPRAVAPLGSTKVFVVDFQNHRLLRFDRP